MTPQDFIQKWGPGGPAYGLNEEQGAQSHFLDLCELLGVPKPGSEAGYLFEEKNSLIGGRTGYADVFRRGAFAWENKAPGKNLDAALKQLLSYSLALSNPPILVVCDRLTIRIHTRFTGHPSETHSVLLAELDVSIFGTLFERGLDPSKRSQLGAHYTDPATIARIVEPVLKRPLLQLWEQLVPVLQALLAKSTKKGDKNYKAAQVKFIGWLDQLKDFRVLDPACGSGNFLFMGLKALKDIEHQSHIEAATLGLEREADLVTGPHNMLGIELNEYAAELARVTVWIGELQWRLLHGYEFKTNPVLEPLDHIECRDALLAFGAGGAAPVEADWPKASVVMGNPPFLGGSKKRRELGDAYFEALSTVFAGRVPGGADLVCYWFDKARAAITRNDLDAAGLVATQSIRAGSNRKVLSAICESTTIYEAWSDESWVNDGAAVRVSLICFGRVDQIPRLDGKAVQLIAADLSDGAITNLTQARFLSENLYAAFKGAEKSGAFEISGTLARQWLKRPNPHGRSNADVILPWRNGSDLADRGKDHWVVDFGVDTPVDAASLYEEPFGYVVLHVKQERLKNSDRGRRENWWRFGRNGADMRQGIKGLFRFAATARVSKHRFFCWLHAPISPDSRLFVVARTDDTTFGLLSSRIHEVWSLAQASMHGVGNDPTYNARSCFETFPFPEGLTPADTAHQRTEEIEGGALIPADISVPNKARAQKARAQAAIKNIAIREQAEAIARAAKRLNDLRESWLNPPEWTQRLPEVIPLGMEKSPYPDRIVPKNGHEKELAERTLTKLYNQRPAWLDAAHQALDAAVAAAYGWADYRADMPDEEILKRLLALNLARAA
ncbi:hypothetical protein BH10PSE16_BH10PSE16_28160 [soil metagenome]